MAHCDTPTSSPASAVAQIKLEINLPDGETKKGELSNWQPQASSKSRSLIPSIETLFLYTNDSLRVGRDQSHK